MANDFEFGAGIILKWTPGDIDKQKGELERYINKSPIKIKIELDNAQFKEFTSNMQNLSSNINKSLSINPDTSGLDKLGTKFNVFTDETGREIEALNKVTKDFTNNLGQNVKEIKLYKQEVDESGNSITTLNSKTREYTDNTKKQRDEIDKLANSMGNLREKSGIQVNNDNSKLNLNQNSAINKVMDETYAQNLKLLEEEKKRKQEASDYARKLTVEEEQQRLKTTTETQKQIERMITGSNETIIQQQSRLAMADGGGMMGIASGRENEERWKKLLNDREIAEQKIIAKEKQETIEIEKQIALYKEKLAIQIKDNQTSYGKFYTPDMSSSVFGKSDLINVDNYKDAIKQTNLELDKTVSKAKEARKENTLAMKETDGFMTTIGKDFGKMMAWGLVATALYAPLRQLQEGITYVNELDNSLNEIRIVTNKTQTEVNNLAQSYNQLGKEMSVTTGELVKTSADLYRQGLNDTQVEDRMKSIIQYAKISSISLEDSNRIITATANATGESVNKIIDIFALLGDTTASGADEIGEALQRVASASENSNISLEKSASWLATISSITRESASTIGRSLNSAISRYESIKKTGFNQEDATKLNDVVKSLSDIGIKATDSQGQLLDFGTVLDTVGAKFANLSKNEQSYITTTLFGTFQRNRGLTLLNNYQDSLKNYENALNASGTAEQKFNIYQESTAAKLDRLKVSWEGFWQSSVNSGTIKGAIDTLTFLMDSIGNLPTILGVATSALLLWKGSLLITKDAQKGWTGVFPTLINSINTLATTENKALWSTMALQVGFQSLKTAFMSNPIGFILGGLTLVYTAYEMISQKFNQSTQEQIEKQKEAIDAYKSQQTELSSLLQSYKQNAELAKTDDNAKIQLLETEKKLKSIFGESAKALDLQNGKIDENIKKIKELSDEKQKDFIRENSLKAKQAQEEVNKRQSPSTSRWSTFTTSEILSEYANSNLIMAQGKYSAQEEINAIRSAMDNINSTGKGEEFLQTLENELERLKTLKTNADELSSMVNSANKEIVQNSIDGLNKLSDKQRTVYSDIKDKVTFTNADQYKNNLQDVVDVLSKWNGKNVDDLNVALHNIDSTLPEVSDKAKQTAKNIEQGAISSSDFAKELSTLQSSMSDVSSAIAEYNDAGKFSQSTILSLIEKHPELINQLKIEDGQLQLTKFAVQSLADTEINSFISRLESQKNFTQQTAIETKARISQLMVEAQAYDTVVSARRESTISLMKSMGSDGGFDNWTFGGSNPYTSEMSKLQAQLNSDTGIDTKIGVLKSLLGQVSSGLSSGSSSTKDSASSPSLLDPTQATINQINLSNQLTDAKNKLTQKEIDLASKNKNYGDQLSKTNELISGNVTEIQQLTDANTQLKSKMDELGHANWLDASGEATLDYINAYNSSSKETQDQMKQTFDSLSKLKKAYLDNSKAIDSVTQSQYSLRQSITDINGQIADQTISIIKSAYQQEKEIFDKTKEHEIQVEQDRHDLIISNIDAEIAKLDQQVSQNDYNKNLTKSQSEVQDIQNQINVLMLDNSPEVNSKRLDLQKQLADKTSSIQDMQYKHDIDLRKQNLNDQKKTEDTKFKNVKDGLDQQKSVQDLVYDNLINDEKYYADLRVDIINGSLDEVKAKLIELQTELGKTSKQVADNIGLNFSKLTEALGGLTSAGNSLNNINTYKPTVVAEGKDAEILRAQYGSNNINIIPGKGLAYQPGTDRYDTNKMYQDVLSSQGIKPIDPNVNLAKFDSGGETQTTGLKWLDGKPGKPERVLSSEQTSSFNKLVDFLPKLNSLTSMIGNFSTPSFTNNFSPSMAGSPTYNLNLNIASLNGSKNDANMVFNTIVQGLKKMGVR